MSGLRCFFWGHNFQLAPYPSRISEAWRYDLLPYLIEEPMIWDIDFERCEFCTASRWRFANEDALKKYTDAYRLAESRAYGIPYARQGDRE